MTKDGVSPASRIWGTAALAAALWFVTFYLDFSNFWIKIALSSALLAVLAAAFQPPASRPAVRPGDIVIGVAAAAVLWGVFWLGKQVSTALFPFAGSQIGAIYGKGDGFSRWGVFFLLLLVTGPAEEIYWRGFLQKNLMARHGRLTGWALATAIYAGVHIWSMNFMLIGAAAVAGAFWGLLYWHCRRLAPVIVSHALWSSFVFSVVPIP
ncbi:MAG: CPBP family intramembrane metalloprotease [Desulfobacterales bacterium]|nr:CPBP family intramembrane metalloprotease [Desulfobacterales bacterium]